MLSSVLTKPSYYALAITGMLSLLVIVIFIRKFPNLKTQSSEKIIIPMTLIGILIGIHGLLHLGLEIAYNFNPIEIVLHRFSFHNL